MSHIVYLGYRVHLGTDTLCASAFFNSQKKNGRRRIEKTMRKPEGRHRDSNPEPSDHVSSTLTTALSRHDRCRRWRRVCDRSVSPTALAINSRPARGVERAYMAPGSGMSYICISEMGAAIGSRTAPKGGSVPEPPLCILLVYIMRSRVVWNCHP